MDPDRKVSLTQLHTMATYYSASNMAARDSAFTFEVCWYDDRSNTMCTRRLIVQGSVSVVRPDR